MAPDASFDSPSVRRHSLVAAVLWLTTISILGAGRVLSAPSSPRAHAFILNHRWTMDWSIELLRMCLYAYIDLHVTTQSTL